MCSRRSPGCRCRSRICSTSPASARAPARTVLDERPPAARTRPIVARLRQAGAVLIGRTNMTEFAFSGVGINPHYGTPGNPFDRARIPGGSSSGAASRSPTAWRSLRSAPTPAGRCAFRRRCAGSPGFKPTARRIPAGRHAAALHHARFHRVRSRAVSRAASSPTRSGGRSSTFAPKPRRSTELRLLIPTNYVLEKLDAEVSAAFERACEALTRAARPPGQTEIQEFDELPGVNSKAGSQRPRLSPGTHRCWRRGRRTYDPRVRIRIERGRDMAAADYVRLRAERERLIASFNDRLVTLRRAADADRRQGRAA